MADQIKALASATTCIDSYIAELTKRIVEVGTYRDLQAVAVEFVMTFPELMPGDGSNDYSWPDTRVAITLDAGTVKALMINKNFDKVSDITAPLRWLADRLGKYTIEDSPELQRRSYAFKDGRFRFQCFFVNNESNVCRFVKVGEQQTPVYALKCDNEDIEQVIA